MTEASAMRVAAAWRCVNIIGGAVATLPLDLIARESENVRRPAVGHPLRPVLTVKPNPWQTPSEFRRMMQAHLLLRGNAYARKVMVGRNVVALIPLHPDRVQAEQLNSLAMQYKVSGANGSTTILAQKDVLHLRGMSLDGVTGMSVLSNMRESLGLALQTEQAGARLFKNGLLAGGVIEHPGKLSAEAAKNLKESLDEKNAGAENAGKWILAEENMKLNPVSLSAEDAQWLGTRDFQRYDIAMFFGVPPHMIGATEKTTSWGSGIESQGIGFVTYTLNDWIKIWEESIKRDLLPEAEWETIDARFNVNGLLRGDAKGRWESYVKALQWGVYSPNEVRAMEDQNPREGGDVYYDPPNTAGNNQEEPSNEPAPVTEN
ncbi:phage portal protein [Pusillimonas sp. DMV24BSW_D]|uniref:phage portal protein n=1 Tax=Neopusillimonas aestuarii TaxID=2716226 RepID=UPI00140DE3F1|nr:phage portal protein [Pusillimonas sp. DMV24BSW_D]QIM48981.1 phage portal protein [Pusillimonas sp. DMV24BSW_D]